MTLEEQIYKFISRHEAQLTTDIKAKDDDIEVRFTTFGSRAGCRAVYEIIQMLDDDMKLKVVEMMKNKMILSK